MGRQITERDKRGYTIYSGKIMEATKEWHETAEGKAAFLKALNERFSFKKDGTIIPKNENSYEPIVLSEYYEGESNGLEKQ